MVAPEAATGRRARGTYHPRFAIRPYPVEWERTLHLRGETITVRPVRPEDEALFLTFFQSVSAEDLRLRFFAPVRDFNHAFLAKLTQLDYARAIAFVAIDAATGTMLGAVRLHADANHESGEYAILIHGDRKGTGLGHALMSLMIDWARIEGLSRVEGTVLRENRPMLAVCRQLGFTARPDKEDGGVIKVSLAL
jgi:acetyltransferase